MPPGVCECLPDAGSTRDDTGQEDCPPSPKVAIHWRCQPASNNRTTKIGRCIDESEDARVVDVIVKIEGSSVEDLGAIHSSFVPTKRDHFSFHLK